jgi:hypothetical protein
MTRLEARAGVTPVCRPHMSAWRTDASSAAPVPPPPQGDLPWVGVLPVQADVEALLVQLQEHLAAAVIKLLQPTQAGTEWWGPGAAVQGPPGSNTLVGMRFGGPETERQGRHGRPSAGWVRAGLTRMVWSFWRLKASRTGESSTVFHWYRRSICACTGWGWGGVILRGGGGGGVLAQGGSWTGAGAGWDLARLLCLGKSIACALLAAIWRRPCRRGRPGTPHPVQPWLLPC